MRKNVRRITDGAVMAALTGLLMVLDGQSGMLIDGILFWVLPIPIIVYTVKYDVSSGFMVATAITIMAFILTLPHIAILIGFSNLIGIVYGIGVKKDLNKSWVLGLTFITTFIYYLISLVIFAGFFGYNAAAELESLTKMIRSLTETFGSNGLDPIKTLMIVNPFFKMLMTFPLFIPAMIAVLQTIITNMISSIILKRLNLAEVKITPVLSIRIDKKWGLAALIILIATYVYNISMSSDFDNVIILLQFIAQLLFIVMGIILCMTYVALKRIPLLSILISLLVIVMPLLIMVIGIIDVFTDVRINIIRRAMNERES